MSIVENQFSENSAGGFKQFKEAVLKDGQITEKEILENKYERSDYNPSQEVKDMRSRILKDYVIGVTNMWTPRVEFNDLSVVQRMMIDQMAFNTYQANNGLSMSADDIQGWRSNAMRPIVRNKCISIAAHATARLIFPKIFAWDRDSNDQQDAAQVMEDLMEWAADQSEYKRTALRRVIAALTDPISWGFTEYGEVQRRVKKILPSGGWEYATQLDESLSGFQDIPVPCDQLYLESFYEPDVQKQGFLIWRRVIPYSLAKAKYGAMYPNFDKHVRPGVQTIYSDANESFYSVYDDNMSQYDVEEIIYWNKNLDVKIIMVNGIMLTEHDNPNPRLDKLYPFDGFGYELINNRCAYYKSLAFKVMQDANIVNTLYPMIIDGTYLSLMPPMINRGGETIGSDVIVPGVVTTLTGDNATLEPIQIAKNMADGFNTLKTVEESINDSSISKTGEGQETKSGTTAYEISRMEQHENTILGLFIQMIAQHVKDFGKLRLGDILQYLTIAEVDSIEGTDLTFKTFLLHNKQSSGGTRSRKIKFDMSLPSEAQTPEEKLALSYDILEEQGGIDSKTELYRVNPELFRNLKYSVAVSPDVLNPRSEDLERAFSLETYDRMIANPMADQEEAFRLLLSTDPKTRRDPDKYIAKQPVMPGMPQMPQAGNGPLSALGGKSQLPQVMNSTSV